MSSDTRTTKYSVAVCEVLTKHGHATNAELLDALHTTWPALSATTVHRITARLAEKGAIGMAPKDNLGNLRYDANTTYHHHFYCECCAKLRDITLEPKLIESLEAALGGCTLNGQLLINGSCGKCNVRKQVEEKI